MVAMVAMATMVHIMTMTATMAMDRRDGGERPRERTMRAKRQWEGNRANDRGSKLLASCILEVCTDNIECAWYTNHQVA